jgi:hypothetical protein
MIHTDDGALVSRLLACHREMPHRFPSGVKGEVLGWRCEACGEWVDDGLRSTSCDVDWRAPYLEHQAAARITELEAEIERLRRQIADGEFARSFGHDA